MLSEAGHQLPAAHAASAQPRIGKRANPFLLDEGKQGGGVPSAGAIRGRQVLPHSRLHRANDKRFEDGRKHGECIMGGVHNGVSRGWGGGGRGDRWGRRGGRVRGDHHVVRVSLWVGVGRGRREVQLNVHVGHDDASDRPGRGGTQGRSVEPVDQGVTSGTPQRNNTRARQRQQRRCAGAHCGSGACSTWPRERWSEGRRRGRQAACTGSVPPADCVGCMQAQVRPSAAPVVPRGSHALHARMMRAGPPNRDFQQQAFPSRIPVQSSKALALQVLVSRHAQVRQKAMAYRGSVVVICHFW